MNYKFRDLKIEKWKDIPEFENKYQASNLGRIRSLNYEGHKGIVKELKIHERKDGYLQVGLNIGKVHKKYLVHRLIAKAFIPHIDKYQIVNHKNGNKTDNRVDNLEWCNCSQNVKHAYENNLHKKYFGKANHNSKKVYQYDFQYNLLKVYDSVSQAQKENNIKHISSCCLGKRKSAGNYIWKYEEII